MYPVTSAAERTLAVKMVQTLRKLNKRDLISLKTGQADLSACENEKNDILEFEWKLKD